MERVRNYAYLMRLDKPIGTLLLLWPTLCALLLASEASVDMKTIWLFCLGAFFARSMGSTIFSIKTLIRKYSEQAKDQLHPEKYLLLKH